MRLDEKSVTNSNKKLELDEMDEKNKKDNKDEKDEEIKKFF